MGIVVEHLFLTCWSSPLNAFPLRSFDAINFATLGYGAALLAYPWWLWREEKKAARRELDIFVFQA